MPFADKFRAMMDLPFPGDTVGGFVVESVDVGHEGVGPGRYVYPTRIVLRGAGGLVAVKRALKALFPAHRMTFSGYGNPYQLICMGPKVEPLGDERYAVTVEGTGARVHLEEELERFAAYLAEEGHLAAGAEGADLGPLVQTYLGKYQGEIKRKVDRYRRKLRKAEV